MALRQWLEAQGAHVHPALDLAADDGLGGRGVVAQGEVSAGELLLRVPISLCLLAPSPLHLCTILEEELSQASSSFWKAYLETLPLQVESVGGWTDAERALLQSTTLSDAPAADRATNLVESRAVRRFGTEKNGWALAPGIDALNDSRGLAEPATSLRDDGDAFEMVAERRLAPFEHVTHLYDDDAPADLLRRYGFCWLHDLPVHVVFDLSCLDVPLLKRTQGRVAITQRDPLPDQLVGAFVLSFLEPSELQATRELCQGHFEHIDFKAALASDPGLETKVQAAIGQLALHRLNSFQPDTAFLEKTLKPSRAAAAKMLRDAEAEVLYALLRALPHSSQ